MIQFDFLEISGSITNFQTRKNANLSRFTLILPDISRFYPYFWDTPQKKERHEFPQRMSWQTCSNYHRTTKKTGRDVSPGGECLVFLYGPTTSQKPSESRGWTRWVRWVSHRRRVTSDSLVGENFFPLGATKMGEFQKRKTERQDGSYKNREWGVGCEMFLEDSTLGGVNQLYFLGWRGCWSFSKGLLLRSGEKFWAKMLGMPGRVQLNHGWTTKGRGVGFLSLSISRPYAGWFQSVCFFKHIFIP